MLLSKHKKGFRMASKGIKIIVKNDNETLYVEASNEEVLDTIKRAIADLRVPDLIDDTRALYVRIFAMLYTEYNDKFTLYKNFDEVEDVITINNRKKTIKVRSIKKPFDIYKLVENMTAIKKIATYNGYIVTNSSIDELEKKLEKKLIWAKQTGSNIEQAEKTLIEFRHSIYIVKL
jgi:hypothetical protein